MVIVRKGRELRLPIAVKRGYSGLYFAPPKYSFEIPVVRKIDSCLVDFQKRKPVRISYFVTKISNFVATVLNWFRDNADTATEGDASEVTRSFFSMGAETSKEATSGEETAAVLEEPTLLPLPESHPNSPSNGEEARLETFVPGKQSAPDLEPRESDKSSTLALSNSLTQENKTKADTVQTSSTASEICVKNATEDIDEAVSEALTRGKHSYLGLESPGSDKSTTRQVVQTTLVPKAVTQEGKTESETAETVPQECKRHTTLPRMDNHPLPPTDKDAALDCIHLLKRELGTITDYPISNANTLNKFITKKSKGPSPLSVWIRQREDENLKVGKIRKRLYRALSELKVVQKKKNKICWNRQEVDRLLLSGQPSGNDMKLESEAEQKTTVEAVAHSPGHRSDIQLSGNTVYLVETKHQLEALGNTFPFTSSSTATTHTSDNVIAVDCEGVPDELFLIQVGTRSGTFVFDCVKLGANVVCHFLAEMLTNTQVTKLFHDLHNDAAAIATIGVIEPLHGTLDTQLAMEFLTGDMFVGFNNLMKELGQTQHATKKIIKCQMKNKQLFAQRPIPRDVLQYAVDDVRLLLNVHEALSERLGKRWYDVQRASDVRARIAATNGGSRHICFDVANSFKIASYELLFVLRPDDMMSPTPLEVSNDTETLLSMLPQDLCDALRDESVKLSDVVLDKGRRPHAWIGGNRVLLGDDSRFVDQQEIDAVVEKLGGFGSDNRAGLERQLHRISAIRNRESNIIGLTVRFGRHVSGNTGIISDLLFGDTAKSILFLGEPGAGKTTVVREVTRLLAERSNVCIVDTSNEIAGDGDIPHPCVGFARRMMVPSLDRQSAVMIECVQNHTPEVMVIDEIGRPTEVEAARTCKNRGVRLIASAHGDLRKLIKNPKLRGLIGGVETVTLGDIQAKAEAKKTPGGAIQKTKAERAGPPTFDILVELERGAHHEWRIVLDSGDAVDRVLRGEEYKAQLRTRIPETGSVHLDLTSC